MKQCWSYFKSVAIADRSSSLGLGGMIGHLRPYSFQDCIKDCGPFWNWDKKPTPNHCAIARSRCSLQRCPRQNQLLEPFVCPRTHEVRLEDKSVNKVDAISIYLEREVGYA